MKKITCLLLLIQSGFMMAQSETVVTVNGKKVQVNTKADNGLTAVNGSVQLGGALTKPSVLTTTADFTLAIKGLEKGTSSDDIVVTDADGVLKTIKPSSFWSIDGNSGTNAANFIGTLDSQPLRFKINNTNAGRIMTTSTAFGYNALGLANTGNSNTAFGDNALSNITTGGSNVAVGSYALNALTTGLSNVAVGSYALNAVTSGGGNIGIGQNALKITTTGINNIGVGVAALTNNTIGKDNIALGRNAMSRNNADKNIGIGTDALFNNITGIQNVAMGFNALNVNVGSNNTAIGNNALNKLFGSNNVALGNDAGSGSGIISNSIFIGSGAASSIEEDNQIVIGFEAVGQGGNTVQIGNSSMISIGGQVAWSNPSDVRLKKDIETSTYGLNFINKLRPVTYHMKSGTTDLQSGFIAQEVEKTANEINYSFSGVVKPRKENDFYSLRYSEFVVPLVKAVQEQQVQIEAQKKTIEEKEAKILEIENRLLKLEQKMK